MIGNMVPSLGIFILTSLLVSIAAGPVNKISAHKTCAVQCSENNKFDYQPGTVYEFSYDAKTTTKMNGASEDSATINMNAMVEIEPLTKCELVMRIKDASLRDSEDDQNSKAFKEAMMKQPLKFSFQDGRIDDVCSMDGDSTWTLNIKRGILSAFQNSMDGFDRNQNLTETDVVGSCDSEYKILDEGRKTMVLKKTKNLLGCSNREGYHLAVQSIGYNVPSFVKSLPLMKSEYKCTQTLNLGLNILQSSTCSEEHVFRPFSSGRNGAMTSTEQTLTFTNKKRAGPPSNENFNQRSTLLFHHQHDTTTKRGNEGKIEAKLQELCQKAAEDIRPEVPEMVNQLIEHMREVDQGVLSRVYKKINQKTICGHKADRIKQFFHDAIPMVGTAASVGMIQELISQKQATGSEAEMWLLSLSFVHHPTKEMVAAAKPLLDERDVSGNILLAVSSLASSYCNVRPDCGRDAEISALIGKLMELTNDCNAQNGGARQIVFALRALGNIGHSHEAVSHLTRCFTRQEVPEEIRIAAMDAFRRVPCDALRSDLMGVFRDESEDSELRLNAYIALMKCPTQKVLSEVRQVLEKEKSNQVGSFVWTHLTNLMETSDPHMQDIRNIVQDEELKKVFNLDQRKFSRNYEGSFFLDSINTGAKVDSNVIFSEKSFIPRSANLNLTIDLFGHAINFLEFGGRIQGMERILENFFGSTGMKEPQMKTENPTNFDKSIDALSASAYMRVFGNELRYWDDKSLSELQSSLRRLINMQAVSFSKTMQLIDSRMIIPTCVGLPLNLTMSATGSISLDAKASFQLRTPEISVDFRPSASVQVKGEMSVNAHVSRAGLKMVTVVHTSTGARLDIRNNKFDLQIPQEKMEIFNLKTDFYIVHRNTEKKQKMIVDNVQKHEICTDKLMKQLTGLTFCQIVKFPNASSQNEAPYFPFTGPVVYDLYMMNEDAPNGYQIEGFTKQSPYSFYMDTPNSKVSRRIAVDTVMKNKNEAHITFKAPWKNIKIEGTVVNMDEMKKLSGKLYLNERTDYAFNAELGMKNTKGLLSFTPKFEITIPQKEMKYEGKIEVKPMKTLMIDMSAKGFIASGINLKVSGEIVPKEVGLTTQLRIGKKEYYLAGRSGRLVSKSGFKYTPSLKITIPNKDIVEFTSEILYEANKKMVLDFKINKVFPRTIAMNAIVLMNAGKTKTKNLLKVVFKSPRGNFKITGDMDKKKDGITSRVIGSYNFGPKYSDHLTLSSKIRDLSLKNSVRYMGSIALASKKRESLTFNLKGQLAKASNHVETKFDLQYGNPKIKSNNLKFTCVLNRALKPISHTYDYTMTIQHPGQEIDYKMEVHHLQSATWPFKKFENTMSIQSASANVLKTSLSYLNGKEKGLPCYKAEASLSYRGTEMKITEKFIQLGAKSFANSLNVQWQNGGNVLIYSTFNKTRTGIYNTETTVSMAGGKEMKVNGMMAVAPGAYKVKVSLEADAGLMSNERINYMAKAGVQYKLKAAQMTTDASLDVVLAEDKTISASLNLKYTKGVSLSSRFLLLTSSDALKSFETKIKWGWGKNKFSAVVVSSLNDKINIKQDLSYTYPNLQLAYTSQVDFLGRTSDIVIDFEQNGSSFNGTMSITKDKEIITDIELKYTGHKTNAKKDIQLRFKMFATSGKINMNTKFDPKKKMLELNGSARFQLPLQQLRQIGASYNLKHNKGLSAIDMSWSSSLTNYKNGKMLVKIKRNLPNMLKATTDVTVNDNPMFNMNANYGRQKDNIDMKVDITEPSGQKTKFSGNINLSGSKKTANVGIKSKYIDFSADGAFEYKGARSVGGELKVTTDGTSVIIGATYMKQGSTHKVSGHLGLPDGRSLKIEGSLDLQNSAATLKTMSPDFPELTEVDMAISFNSDKQMFTNTASLKMMPYFDTTQVEMKFTDKEFSIEIKTKFDSIKQAKVTVMFDGDWVQTQQLKTVFQLNNEKMVDLDINYNFNSMSDFAVSMAALTSHMRYKEFQFDLKNKSPLSVMQSSLKLKMADVLMLDALFQNSSKVSLDAQLLDFDELKSTFVLKGDLNSMTARIITSIAKKEFNRIDVSLKGYGRSITVKVNGPKPVNFDFNMNLDTETLTFNMASTFTLDGSDKYEMSASYEHLSKLQIKTTIPSYQDELLVMLSGDLKAFNVKTQFSHNNQNYELMISNKEYYRLVKGSLNTPYFQDTASFKFDGELSEMNILAQVMHNKDKFELTFSNRGYYQQIDAKLDTPYFKPTLKSSLNGNLEKFTFDLTINVDQQVYEMKASNKDYFRQMNFLLDTPLLNGNFQFEGHLENAKGTFTVLYGNTKYEVSFTSTCDLNNMQTTFFYKLNGKECFKSKLAIKGHGTTVNAMVKIPAILDFEFESEFDMTTVSFDLRSNLQFKREEIYKIVATYEHMTKLIVKYSVLSYNGALKMTVEGNGKISNASLKVDNVLMIDAMFQNSRKISKVSLDAKLLDFDVLKSTFVLKGDLNSMTARIITSIAKKEVNRIDVSLKEYGRSINVKVNGPKPVNFDFNMDLDTETLTFNMASTFTLDGSDKYEMSASYEHLSKLQIKTTIPSYQDELLVMLSGDLKAFNVKTQFSHNNQNYELMISNKEYYRLVKGSLNTPYFQDTASFKFDGELSEMNILAQVMHNKDKFELTFSNRGYYQQIDAKLNTPYFKPTLKSSLNGNLEKFNFDLMINFDQQIYEMKASNGDYFGQINFLLNTPQLNCNFEFNKSGGSFNVDSNFELQGEEIYKIVATYKHLTKLYIKTSFPSFNGELTMTLNGDLKMFNALAKLTLNASKYQLTVSNQGYYRKMNAKLVTPFFTEMASFIFNGDEESFTAQAKFVHDNDKYKLAVSNRKHYEQLTITLTTPFSSDKLDIGFEGDLSSFKSLVIFTLNKVEYKLQVSNEGFYRKINAKLTTPLIETELVFKVKGDLQTFSSMAELSYNGKKYSVQISNKDFYKQMSIKLLTPFSNNSLSFSVDGDINSLNMRVGFVHFKDLYEVVIHNSGYYRNIKVDLNTPLYEGSVEFSLKGNMQSFEMVTKVIHNNEKFQLSASNVNYYRQMKADLTTPFYKGSAEFSLEGDLQSFQMVTKLMHNNEKFQLSASNVNYYRQMKADLTTPFYKGSVDFSLKGNLQSFKIVTKFMHNNEKFQLSASNVNYYRQMKADLTTPFYEGSAEFSLEGDLQSFKMVTKLMHNNEIFQLSASNVNYYRQMKADLTTPFYKGSVDFSLKGNLKSFKMVTKFMHNKEKFQLSASNVNYYRQMKVDLTAPFYEGSVEFALEGNLKSFQMITRVLHNEDEFQLSASNVNYYRQMKADLTTPFYRGSVDFSLKGDLQSFKIVTKVMHNKEKFQLSASNDNYYRQMEADLTTPFYKGSVDFSLKGDLQSFQMVTKAMHNNEKFQLSASNVNYYRQMKSELTTPFYKGSVEFSLEGNLQSFKIVTKAMHNKEMYQLSASNVNYYRQMKADLTSPFYKGSVDFSIKGNLQSFQIYTMVMHNNEKYQLSASNGNYYRQMKADLTTPFYNGSVEFSLEGDLQSFKMVTKAMHNKDEFQLSASNVNYYRQMKADLTTPFYKGSVDFSLKGNLQSFQMVTKAMHNKEKFQLSASNVNYYRQMEADLTTPFYKGSVDFSLKGDLQSLQMVTKLMHNNEKFQLVVSTVNYYRKMKAELTTPYFKDSVDFFFNGTPRKFNTKLTLKHNNIVHEIKASNKDFYRQMNVKLNSPLLNCGFEYSIETAKKSFVVTIEEDKYELTFYTKKSFQFNDITLTTPQHKLKINSKIYQKKKSISGVLNIHFDGLTFTLTGVYKDATPKHIFNANFKSPYFTASLQSSSLDKNRKSSANKKPSLNQYIYEALTQSQNFYNELDFNLKKSGMKVKFSFKGNLQKCKVLSSLKKATDLYELNLSNQKYFQNIDMELSTPQTGSIKFNSNVQSSANRFDLDGTFSHGNNKYVLSISSKSQAKQHVVKFVGPQVKLSGQFNGDLKSFSFNANALFNNEEYEVTASTKNYFREISGKMTTPQLGKQSLSVKVNGKLSDFSGFIEVKNNNEVYRSEMSLNNNEFRLSLPKWLKNLHVKLNGNYKNFEFIVQILNYSGEKFEISATNRNFQEMKAHLAIPQMDDIDVFVKTTGNLRKGGTIMKMSVGENVFVNEVDINVDGSQANFEIKPNYKIFGRSGEAKLQIDLMFEAQSYKYEFEADVDGFQLKSKASVKISSDISVLMTVNIPSLDASEMKLRAVSKGFQKTDMMINLKSPWTGISKIFYEHNTHMGKSFNTKGYIERDGVRSAGYSLDLGFAGDYTFDFSCDYEKSQNKIETKGNLKFQGAKTVATLSAKTPFRVLKKVSITVQTKMLLDGPSVQIDVNLPNQQYSMNIDLSDSNFNGSLNLNMDKKNKDKQYQFQTSYKNTDQHAGVSRSFNFQMILPQRTVSLDSRFENVQHSMVMSGNLMWGESKDQNVGFELMVQKGRGNEGKLRVTTLGRTIELFCRVEVNNNQYSTVGHIMLDENNKAQKVDIKADVIILSDKANIDLTVKFPNQKKGMNLKTSIDFPKGDVIFSSNSEFSMDQDPKKTFKISTKVMSETKDKSEMYTVKIAGNHAHTGFSTELIGRVAISPEQYNAEVEMGYLTLKRQQQKFAIRGEMDRLSRGVNLKLESPSKTIEFDGTLRTGNRYMMSVLKKETGKENMEALFKLNPNSQKMNINLNYDEENPDKVYRVDADMMESKTSLKAYRTGKQGKVDEDAAIYAELKGHNILKTGIKWNPNILQELNMFGYQKLTKYGSELISFGDALSQMLNEEVFMKLSLVKQSFSEDMTPIGDYFAIEYKSLSKDFARAKNLMKQMFEQDSFYVRSVIEAINNVWEKMSFNMDQDLMRLNQVIEDFNRSMNDIMAEAMRIVDLYYEQYSMQLKSEVDEFLAYCQEHYEMMYESAMQMKAEIVSLVKNYPNTIIDIIDGMRQNPYGAKVIDFLVTMYETFSEKTIQTKEHLDTLTSAIYSAHSELNRHLVRVRRNPVVDAIVDAINEVYQKVLWSYNYWDVKDNVLGLKNTLYKFGAKKINEIKDIITDVGMNSLVFDPKRGEIMVEIRFGAAKYFYNHFMSGVEDIERAVMKLRNLMPSFNFDLWDIYYMMKPSTDLDDYIPPFKAEATLFAGQHITTFDGRHLNYKAACSYLLARDFVDGDFSVVANFDADRKAKTLKSLSVTTAHNEQVEIFPDSKVSFNGRVVELPLQLTDATVTREGNLVVVQSRRGYKVMCDNDTQLYTVQISGWYFNKMAGLFGNYNNEPRDDMLMSNNKYTNDLEQFAQSWSVSKQCKSHRNSAAPSHMVPENKECAHLFLQTDSPFSYCFRQVNPDQFYKTCAMQLSSSEATPIDLCNVTSFYQKKCAKKGVHLSTPVMCRMKM